MSIHRTLGTKHLTLTTVRCTNYTMANIARILRVLRENPEGVRFADLARVCDEYFGQPRQTGGSHRVYHTPWLGDPRVNIQNDRGMAKAYQVRQVLRAVRRLQAHGD